MPSISVIVPVYNAANHLAKCIDSILAQRFTNFELILVNDGSSDNSLSVCDSYVAMDSRVQVCDQLNAGASSARNHGIEIAKGDYICFVDADDYVNEYYLNDLFQDVCCEKDIDLVMHGMVRINRNSRIPISFAKTITYILAENSFFKDINLFKFCGPCCKLFKHDILSEYHIRFNENVIYSEDFDFLAKYLSHCNQVRISDKQNYFYVSHEGSVSTRINSFDQEYYAITKLLESLSMLKKRFQNPFLENQINVFLAYYVSRVLTSVYEPPRPSRSVRINNLMSIENTFVKLYRDYFVPPTRNSKRIKWLFMNKCYWLYDMACIMWRWKMERGLLK